MPHAHFPHSCHRSCPNMFLEWDVLAFWKRKQRTDLQRVLVSDSKSPNLHVFRFHGYYFPSTFLIFWGAALIRWCPSPIAIWWDCWLPIEILFSVSPVKSVLKAHKYQVRKLGEDLSKSFKSESGWVQFMVLYIGFSIFISLSHQSQLETNKVRGEKMK